MAVNHLLVLRDKTRAEILRDFRSAPQLLLRSENAFILAQKVGEACRYPKNSEWTSGLQWILPHIAVHGNNRSDALPAADHIDDAPTLVVERPSGAQRLVHELTISRHPDRRASVVVLFLPCRRGKYFAVPARCSPDYALAMLLRGRLFTESDVKMPTVAR